LMTRNVGFGLLLDGDTKHTESRRSSRRCFSSFLFFFFSHAAEGNQVMVGKQR
jgi:hypothetical protein